MPSNLPDNGMATLPPIPNIEDLMDLDIYQPGTNPVPPNNPPNTPGPDTPDPNPPGPNPPNPGPNPNPSPGTWGGNDQLYRDQMYIRDTLSYVPTTDPNTNTTTSPPEMPEWKINTDIISEILIAAAMLATSAVAARFLNGGTKNLENSFGKWAVENLGGKEPSITSMVLYVLSIGLFALDPGLVDGILVFVGMFGFFFNFISAMMYSGTMDIFGYFLLAVAIIKLVEKIWGLDVVQMASDKLGKLKEIFTNEFGPIFDHLKEMFGLK